MAEPTNTRARSTGRWRGIRPRLLAVLLIPIIAALVLGALRMADAVNASAAAARAQSVAELLPDSYRLALRLQFERSLGDQKLDATTLTTATNATDQIVRDWRSHLLSVDVTDNPKLRQDLTNIQAGLGNLAQFRGELLKKDTRLHAQTEYTGLAETLLGLSARLPELDDPNLYQQSQALTEVRSAAQALTDIGDLTGKAIATGSASSYDLVALAQTYGKWQASSEVFARNTSPQAHAQFEVILAGQGGSDVSGPGATVLAGAQRLISTGDPKGLPSLAQYQAGVTQFLAQIADVITLAATDLADDVTASRKAAQRDAVYSAIGIFVVLLIALLSTLLTARSILGPLSQLRQFALDLAQRALPERVRQFEASDGEALDLTIQPLPIGRGDEIGEVADAFDAVHAEAVRLAGEQAETRANVNRMFVNLSRRSQSLVERQLRLIDDLEAGEQDPDHLSNLFRLDHLATRMRRNDESLMVLAGGDTGQATRGPVPVLDVLRAASSEVEQFARVEIESGEAARFRGAVAGDLVHLLAELVENATNFSPPDTSVVVRTSRTSPVAPLVIEIRDLGIGMTPEELEAANAKLRTAGQLDADVARMMGLVVTSRLAHRHGLSVELRGNTPRGVVARVTVPTAALAEVETEAPLAVQAQQAYPEPLDLLPPADAEPAPSRFPKPLVPRSMKAALPPVEETDPVEPPAALSGLDALRGDLAPAAPAEPITPVEPAALSDLPTRTPSTPYVDQAAAAWDAPPASELPTRVPSDPFAEQIVEAQQSLPVAEPAVEPEAEPEPEAAPPGRTGLFGLRSRRSERSEEPAAGAATGLFGVPAADAGESISEIPSPSPLPPAQPEIAPIAASSDLPARVVPPEGFGTAEPRVVPPAGFESPAARFTPSSSAPQQDGPVASESPVNSWFASTVPLRDPEELLNAYLLGKATGSDGAIDNPFKSNGNGHANGIVPAEAPAPVEEAAPEALAEPPAPPVEGFGGLPTRVPNTSMPSVLGGEPAPVELTPVELTPVELTPVEPAPIAEAPVPIAETPAAERPSAVIDPLIARLAADVLNAPSAADALAQDDEDDDTSIFAALQSEWFTRRTPLEARRSQEAAAEAEQAVSEEWSSPGDDGWRRAAELEEQQAVPEIVSSDGLPLRVPGRNLIPGAAPVTTPVGAATVTPRLERRRNRGLTSFQQGVTRARTNDSATPEAEETISNEEEQQ